MAAIRDYHPCLWLSTMNNERTAGIRIPPTIAASDEVPEIRHTWLLLFVLAIGYLLSAKLAAMLTLPQTNVSMVYIPVGLMVAACMRYGYRIWPAIVIGSLLAVLPFLLDNYTVTQSLLIASIQVSADVVQVMLGTWWYRRVSGGAIPMRRVADVMRFILVAALGAQAVGATIGVAGIMLGGKVEATHIPGIWMSWWVSNVISVLCIAPFLLYRSSPSDGPRSRRRYVLHGVYYVAAGVFAGVVFFYRTPWTHLYFEYCAIMIAVGAAFVLSFRGTSTVALIITAVAVTSTALGVGPFNVQSVSESLLLLEAFLMLLTGMSLVIAATLAERERAKEDLRHSAGLFRAAFDDANVGVCMVDIHGRFLSANRALCRLLGYTQEALCGRRFNDVTVEEDRAVGTEHLEAMVKGERHSAVFEKRYRKKDGTTLWAGVSTALVRTVDGQPEHFVTYVQDITERKTAENALRESEERYQQLFELSPDAVAVHADGNIILANAAALRMLGARTRDQVLGRPVMDFVDSEFHAVVRQRIQKELLGLETVPTLEERFLRVDGRPIDVEVTAAPLPHGGKTVSLVVFRDITTRKREERRHRAVYEISRAANEADTPVDLFAAVHRTISSVTNAKNFYIALLDQATDTMSFPYFVDEADQNPGPRKAGRGLTEYVLRSGKPLFCDDATDALLRQAGEVELIGVPSPIWLGVPLMVERKVLGAMVIQDHHDPHAFGLRDLQILEYVSEQTAKAIERQEHVAQMRASLAEKGVLLKEIHHRVKNNMQVISSLLNLEAQQIAEGQTRQILTESINRIRSMAMVHETLYQSDNMARIDFGEYVQSVTFGLMRSIHHSGIEVTVNVESVHLDIDRAIPCGLIVNELVSNALKHAFPAGREGKVEVSLKMLPAGSVELAVCDDGVGFPVGKPLDELTTMGMTLVTSLIKQIQGRVALDANKGTRFAVTFPLGV
jgi:PAS domain S-box-containing protein